MTSVGVLLYGPPASGKDTITEALTAESPLFELFRRLKVGAGRTRGYRMASATEIAALESRGHILYENQRYGARYLVDQPELARLLSAGRIPVVHLGQPEAIAPIVAATPATRWLIVEVWCPREEAARRGSARGTGDLPARLRAWDETSRLADPDLRIDTAHTAPDAAAELIAGAVDSAWTVVVPALNPTDEEGVVDLAAVRRYAANASRTWVDRILVNGSTTRGDRLTVRGREDILDRWLEEIDAGRLLACAWNPEDLLVAARRGVTPMAVMKGLTGPDTAVAFLRDLPAPATIYSHPMFGAAFTPELAKRASDQGFLPVGGKLAKVTLDELTQIRRDTPNFEAWDGSSRRIYASLKAGASGIVATPLSLLLAEGLPAKRIGPLQAVIDPIQEALDELPDRPTRRSYLLERLSTRIAS